MVLRLHNFQRLLSLNASKHIKYRSYCVVHNPWKEPVPKPERVKVGNGTLELRCGKLARFTDGCAVAKLGDTSVMVAVVSKPRNAPASFLPLTVDYRQKAAAAGRIPTNYLRRELGPSVTEILTSRLIDRSLRPLFPSGFSFDTQVMCNLLAVDGDNHPDVLSINAASAALAISDIPWNGPVGAVRVGYIDNEVVINPTRSELKHSVLNLVVTGVKKKKIVMLESSSEEMWTQDFCKALKAGVNQTQSVITAIEKLQKKHGKAKRELVEQPVLDEKIFNSLKLMSTAKIRDVLTNSQHHKISRDEAIRDIRTSVLTDLKEHYTDVEDHLLNDAFNKHVRTLFRDLIFENNARCDGRGLNELRPITCEVDLYAPLHGSALFQRGQTQVLSSVTFDSPDSAAKLDPISSLIGGMKEKNFFLHYEFPPYATNETGRLGAVGRRELGHGILAEKALRPVIPENFPFTIRLNAEVLESNGSSSMASACAGSLALMDAGVQIESPVAGVAMGMVSRENEGQISDYRILTDLLGIEDYMGDMDFKMAGTRKGITALQADVKLEGIPLKVAMEATRAAEGALGDILKIMHTTLPKPRASLKMNCPVMEDITIPVHKRSQFLGVGGYNLRKLMAETGVSITPDDLETFQVFAPNQQAMDEAKEKIEQALQEEREPTLEFGAIYKAKVVEIREEGLMIQLYPRMKPVLLHNSQLVQQRISHPSVLGFQVGQEMSVKYFGRDPASGQMRLSRKVLHTRPSIKPVNLGAVGSGGSGSITATTSDGTESRTQKKKDKVTVEEDDMLIIGDDMEEDVSEDKTEAKENWTEIDTEVDSDEKS